MNIVFCFRALFIVERRRRSSSKGEGEDKLWSRAHHMTAQVNRGGYRVGKEDELGYAEEEESRPAQRRKEEKEKAKLGGACWANATGPLLFFSFSVLLFGPQHFLPTFILILFNSHNS